VTMNDPSGLFPPLLLFMGGKALALGIAAAGAYSSAWVVDRIKSARDGKKSTDAVDGMNTVAPHVLKGWQYSTFPGRIVMGNPAMQVVGQFVLHGRSDSKRSEEDK